MMLSWNLSLLLSLSETIPKDYSENYTVWIAIILWKDSDRNLSIYKVQLVPHTATLSALKYDKIYP